jgi:phosphatidate cytidylyltransferase
MFRLLNWYFFFICIYFVYGKILQQHIQVVHLATPAVGYITNQHSFKAFIAWTIGFCTFILLLEKGAYKYQFTQFGWTHVTLLMIVVSASSMINNMYDGMVSRAQATFFAMPYLVLPRLRASAQRIEQRRRR